MARPYWSGQIQISLVSFAVSLFPATEAASEIALHQIDRRTGERIHHKNVTEDRTGVDRADIVKGYEFRKGEYVTLEPEEIAHLRIPSKKTLQIVQFVDIGEIDPGYFEKPYFVVPQAGDQAHAFAVIRKALQETGKAGLGEAAFAGREHLIALMPPPDPKVRGLMAYALRYRAELRDAAEYFSGIKDVSLDKDQLSLAKELIRRNTAKFHPEKFVDDYETALREMIDAKIKHQPVPHEESRPKRAKVINLMDALRRSLGQDAPTPPRKTSRPVHSVSASRTAAKSRTKRARGIKLVKSDSRGRRTA